MLTKFIIYCLLMWVNDKKNYILYRRLELCVDDSKSNLLVIFCSFRKPIQNYASVHFFMNNY